MTTTQTLSFSIYHQMIATDWPYVRDKGLVTTSRGEKGKDQDIKNTDTFLDNHLPSLLKKVGVSRNNNLYGFIGNDAVLINIRDGGSDPLLQKSIRRKSNTTQTAG